MNNKQKVNKGLRSLLANIEKTNTPAEKSELLREYSNSIIHLRPEQIETNPFQPRTEFDPEQLMELAKSIKVNGLIQPITVRDMGDGHFQIISGERRWRASKMAGISSIPAFVRVANDQEMLEMALVENVQRADLNAIEIAISYQRLMEECQLTHEALSDRVGKERSTVTNYVRLLKLPPDVQAALKNGQISMGHARALAGIENIVRQKQIFQQCMEQHLSVRALENLIKAENQIPSTKKSSKKATNENAEITKLQSSISYSLGTPVQIKRSEQGSGQIVIPFKNDLEFNLLIEKLMSENT